MIIARNVYSLIFDLLASCKMYVIWQIALLVTTRPLCGLVGNVGDNPRKSVECVLVWGSLKEPLRLGDWTVQSD